MGIGLKNARRAALLDRDGVLNRAVVRDGRPHPPASLAELEIVPEAPAALAELHDRGFLLLVVTNQPDLARGTLSAAWVERLHTMLRAALRLDDIFVCPHDDQDGCPCRKPKPGLLLAAAAKHGVDLGASYVIGDRWRDIDAGHAAGCTTVWIDYGYQERGPSRPPAARVVSLAEAVAWIVAREESPREDRL